MRAGQGVLNGELLWVLRGCRSAERWNSVVLPLANLRYVLAPCSPALCPSCGCGCGVTTSLTSRQLSKGHPLPICTPRAEHQAPHQSVWCFYSLSPQCIQPSGCTRPGEALALCLGCSDRIALTIFSQTVPRLSGQLIQYIIVLFVARGAPVLSRGGEAARQTFPLKRLLRMPMGQPWCSGGCRQHMITGGANASTRL
jgi:hypothetical protein